MAYTYRQVVGALILYIGVLCVEGGYNALSHFL